MAKGSKGKKGGKRKRTQWDDEKDVPKTPRGGAIQDEGEPRKKRGESMFTQWKKQKQVLNQKRRAVETSIAQRKQEQYNRLRGRTDDDDEDDDGDDDHAAQDDDDDESSNDDEKKPSTFNSFVSRFQRQKPSFGDDEEDDDEEEDDEELVDEEGEDEGDAEDEGDDPAEEHEAVEDDEEDEEDAPVDASAAAAADDDENDPYRQRFLKQELTAPDIDILSKKPSAFQVVEQWKDLEVSVRPALVPASTGAKPLSHIRQRLLDTWTTNNVVDITPLQQLVHGPLHQYQDVMFCNQSTDNSAEIRQVVMMHVVNHVLKARDTISRHNERLSKASDDDAEYRDQGFARPSVLLLAPLRSSAHALVHQLLDLLPSTVTTIHNKDRFDEEFGESDLVKDDDNDDDDEEDEEGGTEWQKLFQAGNNDDAFQIGISFSRKTVKLYTDYSRADIIVASPLALRQKVGDVLVDIVAGDKSTVKLPVDFLSSIEICLLDSASVLLMQNMDHVRAVMNAINVTPKEAPHADFSRIREWNLNHQAHYFRQTIVLSHASDAQLNNLVTKSCHNLRGVCRIAPVYDLQHVVPSVSHVIPSIKQIFQRLDVPSQPSSCPLAKEPDVRFQYFQQHILTPLLDHPTKHTMIFVPSYFDFVRLRNVFSSQKRLISCAAISEYSTDSQISRARSRFYHGQINVLLMTERFHFYKQYRIRGVHQIFWYAPPSLGPFYAEVLNAIEPEDDTKSVVLCSRFDTLRMQQIVGTKKAQRMCGSTADTKSVYMFC
ncbi:Aste57867_8585 [Aphanomyces stellatus]|uniref:Aste57867_8585 protein n=1 Tax=Aphanomyces stellatus TaxID=120398 RepID=A0A485KKM2_9STRA|nr:hypothetical protein As57867_008553 [Aphanomyces stellatus]VFT85471.1 Aste57867_8585 [Aphanomyces stellatus]